MRRKPYRIASLKLNVPADLLGRVQLRLPPNPTNTGPAYGAMSALVEDLLRRYVDEAEAAVIAERETQKEPTHV